MLPYLGDNKPEKGGEDWFSNLSEAQQKQMMGIEKWKAWKDGKFKLGQLSADHQDDVYGAMKSEASLKDLLNN